MLSKNEKIALVIGGVAAAGGVGYLIFSAKKAEAAPKQPQLPPPPPPKVPPSVPAYGSTDPGVLVAASQQEQWEAAAKDAAEQAAQAMGGIANNPLPQPGSGPLGTPPEWEIPVPVLPEGYEMPDLGALGDAAGDYFGGFGDFGL